MAAGKGRALAPRAAEPDTGQPSALFFPSLIPHCSSFLSSLTLTFLDDSFFTGILEGGEEGADVRGKSDKRT